MSKEMNKEVEEELDIENLDDEEFLENFDELDNKIEPNNQIQETIQTSQNEEVEDNQENIQQEEENQDQPKVNDGEEPYIPDGFDVETFNKIPDEYKRIFQPIKANGVEIQPDPDKMIQLIQLGSKYYADREKIKPQLQTVKMLEKNNIDIDTLNFLIDIKNGNKDALKKLIHDFEIDPIDLDLEDDEKIEYQPNNYRPSEQEIKMDEIVSKIEQSPKFNDLVSEVEKFDDQSKVEIEKDPIILEVLTEHMEAGIYDTVNEEIKRGKIFGQYVNKPFVEQYKEALENLMQKGVITLGKQQPQVNNNNNQVAQIQDANLNLQQQVNRQPQQPQYVPSQVLQPTQTVINTAPQYQGEPDWGELSDEEYLKMINKF
jgi:hypothetical protein